jgi:hypothetical protein
MVNISKIRTVIRKKRATLITVETALNTRRTMPSAIKAAKANIENIIIKILPLVVSYIYICRNYDFMKL